VWQGHRESICGFALDPKRQEVVSCGQDGRLRTWELKTGRGITDVSIPAGWTGPLARHSTSHVLVGGSDGIVRMVRLRDGVCCTTLKGHEDRVTAIKSPHNGHSCLTGSRDGTVRFWRIDEPRCELVLRGHTDAVSTVDLCPDEDRAISGGWDRTLRVWDLQEGRCIHTLRGHRRWITSACLCPKRMMAFSGDWEGSIRFWGLGRTGPPAPFELCIPRTVSDLNRSARVVTRALNDVTAALHGEGPGRAVERIDAARQQPGYNKDPALLRLRHQIGQRGRPVALQGLWLRDERPVCSSALTALRFAARVPHLACAGGGSRLGVWDLEDSEGFRIMVDPGADVRYVDISHDGQRAVSGGRDGVLRVWDVSSGLVSRRMDARTGPVSCVRFCSNGDGLLSGDNDGLVHLWDWRKSECVATFSGHTQVVEDIRVLPGERFLSASTDFSMRLWELETGRCTARLLGHRGAVASVAVCPKTGVAISGGRDRTLILWDLNSLVVRRRLRNPNGFVESVCAEPHGRWAFSGSRQQSPLLWDLRAGQAVRVPGDPVQCRGMPALSLGGRWLALGGPDGAVRVMELLWDWAFD
jgi:WD40 repeat protein